MGIQQLSIIMELQRSECANNSVKCSLLRSLFLHSTDEKQRKRTNRQVYIDWKKRSFKLLIRSIRQEKKLSGWQVDEKEENYKLEKNNEHAHKLMYVT